MPSFERIVTLAPLIDSATYGSMPLVSHNFTYLARHLHLSSIEKRKYRKGCERPARIDVQ
jgi:hypothetical protein